MSFVDLDIRRLPRGGFVIVEGARQVVNKIYPTAEDAEYRLPTLARQIASARATVRDCLHCRAPFPSQGAHHRMCDCCRADPGREVVR